MFVALSEVRLTLLPLRFHLPWFVGELGVAIWMTLAFGGLSSFLFISAIVSFSYRMPKQLIYIAYGAAWLALNVLNWKHEDYQLLIVLNLFSLVVILYNRRLAIAEQDRQAFMTTNDHLRRQTYDLQQAKQEIIHYTQKIEQLVQTEERNRIAQELHDELGHRLVRLKLMMDAAAQLSPQSPDQAALLYQQVRDQFSGTMDVMRTTVQRMKPPVMLMRAYSLEQLIADYQSSGIHIDYGIEGVPYPLYPSIEITIYRNTQEAITNAIRHGQATTVRIRLCYTRDAIHLHVANNGTLPLAAPAPGLGWGGMKDRVKTLGGTITINLEPEFSIRTVLPTKLNHPSYAMMDYL